MNDLAEKENFIVLYPEQSGSANNSKCWNFFIPSNVSRGAGEPALIVGMVNEVKSRYDIDDKRVYAAGLSAGGAMSVVMGVTYPDVFSAVGVVAGLEYKPASSAKMAFDAKKKGGPDPSAQGIEAYKAMGSNARVVPVIVFQGMDDHTVYPVNSDQVICQWAKANDLADDGRENNSIDDKPDQTTKGQVPNGKNYTEYIYNDSKGNAIMEKYTIESMDHAWPGGDSSGSYTDPKGPDASRLMWEFFKANKK